MNIIIKCICGEPLELVSDPYNNKGIVEIQIGRCKICLKDVCERTYHEGLVRGSHLEIPLPYDNIVGPTSEAIKEGRIK